MATETRVVNLRHDEPFDVYIGRGSDWGNPFTIFYTNNPALTVVGSREDAITRYEEYLRSRPDLMARLPELKGKTLACYCKPRACHGDVLAQLADES